MHLSQPSALAALAAHWARLDAGNGGFAALTTRGRVYSFGLLSSGAATSLWWHQDRGAELVSVPLPTRR